MSESAKGEKFDATGAKTSFLQSDAGLINDIIDKARSADLSRL